MFVNSHETGAIEKFLVLITKITMKRQKYQIPSSQTIEISISFNSHKNWYNGKTFGTDYGNNNEKLKFSNDRKSNNGNINIVQLTRKSMGW